ncbi:hypothetical protein [Mycobacterium malmoense]|uniref:hypothetical protein n=1 Tax=Mycobacterium malmoense TaxID=1780 RepID=UPI0008F86703|nr:hypothetical protein [Mycobacterium malmoense]OIN79354.1 hypothetical protein BMG05_18385 [Mycobacterium malmoense]
MSASGAATVTCTAGPGTAVRTRLAAGGITVTCTAGPGVGVSPRVARGAATVYAMALPGKAENGVFVTPNQRWRIAVQACRGGPGGGPGPILTYDLKVTNLLLNRNLSDGCDISFDVNLNDTSAAGLQFKSYGYYIHASKIMYPGKERLWCTGITQPSDVDETSPILHLKAKGYAAYPKDIPWLEDLNWVANDAFRPVVEIWRHLQQDFPNGNLDVEVYPAASGVEMLPGYAFDGNLLNLNFFATFIRQTDKLDCGDYINALARDIPFDYREESEWNADRSGVIKRLHLGYPRLGVIQENLAFVLTENVLSAKPHTEATTDYATDVGVTGWFPGVEYCVSDDTEVMTREGWQRYDEISVGTTVLTQNNETGLAEWQSVEAVNVFEGERWIYETNFRGHSSASTAEHRWPVAWFSHPGQPWRRRWATTASFTKNEKVSCAAPVVDLPSTPKYDDALVELLAWYWTEGTWAVPGGKIAISQWGNHIERIKAAAARLFGPETVGSNLRKGDGEECVWRGAVWQAQRNNTIVIFGSAASAVFLEHIVDYRTKAVSYDFIANLTQAQLELFINCSVWADADSDWDPTDQVHFGQKYEHNIDVLQFACQLAGRKSVKHTSRTMNGQPWYGLGIYAQHRTKIKAKTMLDNMERRWHKGVVWCPTTPNGTWCARRKGTVYFTGNSSQLANADPDRLRRYLSEDDAFIDSNERAKAWAGRRLARRQTPPYWETITINPLHSNAPFGSFDVGDTIPVSGDMPGVGYISQDHKIIAISTKVDDKSGAEVTQLTLKAEGAFNYDPIFFPGGVTNIIFNSGFDFNLSGWTATGPGWAWDGTQGSPRLGSVKITADGTNHDLLTQSYGLNPFQIFPMSIKVKCSGAASVAGSAAVQLVAQFYDDDNNPTQAFEVAALTGPNGMVPWVTLSGNLLTPAGSTRVAMRLHVDAAMTGGDVWFDNAVIQL